MEGNIIAIGMILTVAVTGFALVGSKREKFSWQWFTAPFAIWCLLMILFFPIVANKNGNALIVFAVTSLCASLAFGIWIIPVWRCLALIAFTLGMAFGLTHYANDAIDSGRYTSFSHPFVRTRDTLYFRLRDAERAYPRAYLAGWLADQPFAANIPAELTRNTRRMPHDAWHSFFTGLRPVELQPVEAWYGGGKIKDAIIEYRARAEK